MNFQEIPQFPRAYYSVHVGFGYLQETLDQWNRPETPLILNPEWQRGHVWTKKQQSSFIEYMLKGGTTGQDIYFNCSSWQNMYNTPVYCVDGLQRLTAVQGFMRNEIKAFDCFFKEFTGVMRLTELRFVFNMLCIKNKRDLLKVYYDFNSGGTPHKPKEIARIAKMIEETGEDETL